MSAFFFWTGVVWWLCAAAVVIIATLDYWIWRERAVETTRPGASSSATDGRTLGLVAQPPGREQPATTPPEAGLTRPGRATPKVSRPTGH
jgi:hypothetical protein